MEKLLVAFGFILHQNNYNIDRSMNNGISHIEFDKITNTVNMKFCEDIYTLYNWKNGLKKEFQEKDEILHCGFYLSIDDAVNIYKQWSLEAKLWNKNYFPFFMSGGGEFLLINNDNKSNDYLKIMIYAPLNLKSNKLMVIYENLPTMFETIVECYNQKAYFFIDNELEIDFDKLYEIANKKNPTAIYWKE